MKKKKWEMKWPREVELRSEWGWIMDGERIQSGVKAIADYEEKREKKKQTKEGYAMQEAMGSPW